MNLFKDNQLSVIYENSNIIILPPG